MNAFSAPRKRLFPLRYWARFGMILGLLVVPFLSTRAQPPSPPVHYYHQESLPPGEVGAVRRQIGPPAAHYFQPVKVFAPEGVMISIARGGGFGEAQMTPMLSGLRVGDVYRLRLIGIPYHSGQELFPTIEVIDRLYPPAGQEVRFPIRVELTQEDLELALQGKFVTKVVYVEDPLAALPVRTDEKPDDLLNFDVQPGQNPLAVADTMGRPVAIVRLGGRVPNLAAGPDPAFLFQSPEWIDYEEFTIETARRPERSSRGMPAGDGRRTPSASRPRIR